MNEEVDIMVTTGEPTNASAARGPSPTLAVRRPDDESRPEVPVMVLRSHSRGGRSSACAQEPSSQAGNCPTVNENLGVQATRPEKFRPEPEIQPSHGMGSNPSPLGNDPTDNRSEVPTEQPEVSTGPNGRNLEVVTGPHHPQTGEVFNFMHKLFHHNELLPNIFRHTSQKILICILITLALKTNHISNYLLPLWGNVL